MRVEIKKESGSVLEYLQLQGITLTAPCGGKGTCGKCRVKVKEIEVPISDEDRGFLKKSELEEGYRLACTLKSRQGMQIEIPDELGHFNIVVDYKEEEEKEIHPHIKIEKVKIEGLGEGLGLVDAINKAIGKRTSCTVQAMRALNGLDINKIDYLYVTRDDKGNIYDISVIKEALYGLAIDIGTTTIAIELVDLESGEAKRVYSGLNSQARYGADVISRINYANSNGIKVLQHCIRKDIEEYISALCKLEKVNKNNIKHIVVSGNTTMLHMLIGADCKSIGEFPFTPIFLELMDLRIEEVFEGIYGKLTLLPGISTYVGADITSGISKCRMHKAGAINLFIDIGTNGEMSIGNKDKLYTLATAAGPAFEGGNISCGVGSVEGAINSVSYKDNRFEVTTIDEREPIGICGSGLIDSIACALEAEAIDETGMIEEGDTICITEKVVLTQEDIRQVQLAKAAIRAGIEVLVKECGIEMEDIHCVYLAGGFGQFMNATSVTAIGMIPKQLQHKIERVGNSSLAGAKKYIIDNRVQEDLEWIRRNAQPLNLGSNALFNQLFMESMFFE